MKARVGKLFALLPDPVLDVMTRVADWWTDTIEWAIFSRHVRRFARRFRG